jgi:hypothetical protein
VRKQPRRKHLPLLTLPAHEKNEQKQLKLHYIIRFLGGFGNTREKVRGDFLRLLFKVLALMDNCPVLVAPTLPIKRESMPPKAAKQLQSC